MTTKNMPRRLAATPQPAPAPSAPDPKLDAKVAGLAKILGCDATPEAVLEATQALLGAPASADVAARRKLSPREIEMCRARKVRPSVYAASRDAIRARRVGGSR